MNVCLKCLVTCLWQERWHILQKFINEIQKSRHGSFPLLLLQNKLFSIISDPAFTKANKVLDHYFVKHLRKTGNIASIVHKKPICNEQMKKLLQWWARTGREQEFLHSYRAWPSFTFVSFLGRENQRQRMPTILLLRRTPQEIEYFELNQGWPSY